MLTKAAEDFTYIPLAISNISLFVLFICYALLCVRKGKVTDVSVLFLFFNIHPSSHTGDLWYSSSILITKKLSIYHLP